MFRTTHIRTKLALALAVPMAGLVAVAGFEVIDAKTQVDDARSQAEMAEASIGPGSLVVHLQNERDRASIDLIGFGANAELPVEDNAEARKLTDPAAVDFADETNSRGLLVRQAYEPAWVAFQGLDELRADIDAYTGPMDANNDQFADDIFHRYTDIIEAFFDGQSALIVDDASLRNGAEIVDASTRQSELRARIWRQLAQAATTDRLDAPFVRQDVAALFDRSHQLDDVLRANAVGPYAEVVTRSLAEVDVQSFNRQVETYLAGGGVEISPLLSVAAADPESGYTGLRARAAGLLKADATRTQDNAIFREQVFAGAAFGGLLLALLIVSVGSRSITRPLRSLKEQAEEMASTRLPAAVRQILDTPGGEDVVIPEVQPIKVKTRDEVAEVAAALSEVQSSAVDLAVEQAVLRRNISDSYINLGRRNQNLLSRQLDFITELERNETDPDSLEGLFRLDHLATRMRRNAESLLVLAGIEPPRQWSASLKVADVVRAALGEVEDYQRVVVRHLEPAAVTGAVAADVAHVLAELIENALSFSPPDQTVEVKGRLTTSGYTVVITDNGIGMAADDIERANRRLAGKESFTVAPSRYLGHYVAGHLASRLNIHVELQDSPAGGITARIEVPMGLLDDDELERSLTPAPAQVPMAAEPVVAGPTAAAVSTETTASGLPRRGERGRPMVSGVDDEADSAPAPLVPAAGPAAAPPRREHVEPEPAREPEPAVAASSAPASDPPANQSAMAGVGLSGLAVTRPPGPSMFTVAANNARGGTNGHATAGGLSRRVPGAQRPDAVMAPRNADQDPEEPARSSPEDVYSFLSNFQSGVARGRADAATEPPTGDQEDGR